MKAGRVFRSIISGTIVLLPIFTAPAFANNITASVPQAGSVLTTSPNSISITTATDISEQGSSIVVNDPNGVAVDDGSMTVNGNNAIVGLTELSRSGVYTVNYTLLSLSEAEDPLTGSYTFLFNAPSSVGSPTPDPTPVTPTEAEKNLNGGSNAFVYTLLVLAAFVFIFLIWYAKQSFGGSKKPKRK